MSKLEKYRRDYLVSVSELSRLTDISLQTIYRIEKGYSCSMVTKRKILLALKLGLQEVNKIF